MSKAREASVTKSSTHMEDVVKEKLCELVTKDSKRSHLKTEGFRNEELFGRKIFLGGLVVSCCENILLLITGR